MKLFRTYRSVSCCLFETASDAGAPAEGNIPDRWQGEAEECKNGWEKWGEEEKWRRKRGRRKSEGGGKVREEEKWEEEKWEEEEKWGRKSGGRGNNDRK